MSSIQKVFGANVRVERERAGMTQQQLADAAGMGRPYLSGIEQGQYNWTISTAAALAAALNCHLSVLLKRRGRKRNPSPEESAEK